MVSPEIRHPYVSEGKIHDEEYFSCTFTVGTVCNHENGWYVTVPFWIFSKRVFVCSDCGEVLDEDFRRIQKAKATEVDSGLSEVEEEDKLLTDPSRSG